MDIGRRIGIDYAAGTYIRQILDRLLIDLSWASSRLEGNTYSLLETERLIAFGESAPGRNKPCPIYCRMKIELIIITFCIIVDKKYNL